MNEVFKKCWVTPLFLEENIKGTNVGSTTTPPYSEGFVLGLVTYSS